MKDETRAFLAAICSVRPLLILTPCLFMGSTRSGYCFQGENAFEIQELPRKFDPRDLSL